MKRICIIGPSGTGKTDLAKYISSRYRIPFISGSSRDVTRSMNEINSQSDLIKLCSNQPDQALTVYRSIRNMRESIYDDNSEFVTDRGIPDLIVYSTLQLFPHLPPEHTELFMDQMLEIIKEQSNVLYIFLPFNYKHLIEDNSHRITNRLYQKMVSNCFDIVNKTYLHYDNLIVIQDWDWETRVDIIDSMFDKKPMEIIKNQIDKWLKRK